MHVASNGQFFWWYCLSRLETLFLIITNTTQCEVLAEGVTAGREIVVNAVAAEIADDTEEVDDGEIDELYVGMKKSATAAMKVAEGVTGGREIVVNAVAAEIADDTEEVDDGEIDELYVGMKKSATAAMKGLGKS
ncbi:hypothetical protein RHSIM_Rhsim08G0151300 [Rhododendron simsii]|uniref:Uncharacterized protein n=1 Tax=Rhododendron simsii TaxID=118357 RepID=A0A834LDK5_RHOSS|nr:hypothetical protein RHSIM_Rhsim08G0151300 [Rhododendron simsii]